MTTETIQGPPCDLCGEYAAVMSLMSYADYAQMKMCSNCAPHFMRTMADSIDGRQTADPEPEADTPAASEEPPAGDPAAAQFAPDDAVAPEEGSAYDHWASTTHVRRSTHGHRSAARRPDDTQKGNPE